MPEKIERIPDINDKKAIASMGSMLAFNGTTCFLGFSCLKLLNACRSFENLLLTIHKEELAMNLLSEGFVDWMLQQ